MSEKEFAKTLIDRIPEEQMVYVVAYLQDAASGDIPNDETLAAFKEIEDGLGETFSGSTEDFIAKMLED